MYCTADTRVEVIRILQPLGAQALSFFSGGAMVALVFGAGVVLTFRSGFFQLRGLPFILRGTAGTLLKRDKKDGEISSFQAVSTALAGTMGVGNIAGVATALTLGGPGSIFWMWVSAFFGMMTKYSEIYLAVRFRVRSEDGGWRGGPMYYMEHISGKKWLGGFFAFFCALASFGIGNMTQVNAVSSSAFTAFGVSRAVSGIVVALAVGLVIVGGVKRIATVAEVVIPFISIAYIACAATAILRNADALGGAFSLIWSGASGLGGAAAGALGYTVSAAMRFGISRGVFTNEAGMGSAPIVHAAANCQSPVHQSIWGIFEVFLDTIVVCTLTALVLLTAQNGELWQSGLDGVDMTSAAFVSVFGPAGAKFIAFSIVFFAVAGMLGWCFYGETAVGYLTGQSKAAIGIYRGLFIVCAFLGAVSSLRFIWGVADVLNALMAIPNIIAIWALRRYIGTAMAEK